MWGSVLAVVLVVAGAGCSDDGDDKADDPPTTTESEAATEGDAGDGSTTTEPSVGLCPYITTEAVSEALAQPVELLEGSDLVCDFSVGEATSIQLTVIGGDLDTNAFYDDAVGRCAEGTSVEVEAGDRAFACVAVGPAAARQDGDVVTSFLTTGLEDETAGRDALAALLPQVTLAE